MNQKHQPVATAAAQALFVIVTFVTGVETPQTQQIHYFLEKYKTARERCFPVWCSTKKKKTLELAVSRIRKGSNHYKTRKGKNNEVYRKYNMLEKEGNITSPSLCQMKRKIRN